MTKVRERGEKVKPSRANRLFSMAESEKPGNYLKSVKKRERGLYARRQMLA
jgi:hypothetical protein